MGIFSKIFKEVVDVAEVGIAITKDVVKSPLRVIEQLDWDSDHLDLLKDTKQKLKELDEATCQQNK